MTFCAMELLSFLLMQSLLASRHNKPGASPVQTEVLFLLSVWGCEACKSNKK